MNESKGTRPESLATRVRRGVALLDEKVPGWHQRIDVEKLDINSPTGCVLGQLFCCFFCGLRQIGFTKYLADPHGLNAADDEVQGLTRLWRFVVRTRQAAQQWLLLAHREGSSFDLVYRIELDGQVTVWTPDLGWHESAFHNLRECSEYDQRHFADHLVPVSVEQLPVGAR